MYLKNLDMRDTFVRIYFHKILDTQHPFRIFCEVSKKNARIYLCCATFARVSKFARI